MKMRLTIVLLLIFFSFQKIEAEKHDYESLRKIRSLAVSGNAEACLALGNAYFSGNGVHRDLYSAFKWYYDAAERGNGSAQFNVAICYDQGMGVSRNSVEAMRWYSRAAENGIVQAKYNLALYYLKGANFDSDSGTVVLNPDAKKALEFLQECSNAGFPPADREMAKILLDRKSPFRNTEAGMNYLHMAVHGEDPEAMFMLAKIELGRGASLNEVFPLINKAAENDIEDAYEYAAVCYETGTGCSEDDQKAIEYYIKAAKNNKKASQVRLGEYYFNGTIVKMDIFQSRYWFEKAAEQGDPYAIFMLGTFAESGIGEKVDRKKAMRLYIRSAKLGFPRAQYNVAMFYSGRGAEAEEDSDMAYFWLRKAALENEPNAQKELGFYCIMGEGTRKNYSYGLNWLTFSSKKGNEEAREFLEKLKLD